MKHTKLIVIAVAVIIGIALVLVLVMNTDIKNLFMALHGK
jgi:uncharacterized protein YxeA